MKKYIFINLITVLLLFSCKFGNRSSDQGLDGMPSDDPSAYGTVEHSSAVAKTPEGTLPPEAMSEDFYKDVEDGPSISSSDDNKKIKIKKHTDGRIYVGLMSRGGGNSQNATLFIVKDGEEGNFKTAMTSGNGSFDAYSFDSDKARRKESGSNKEYDTIKVETKSDKVSFSGTDGANYSLDKNKLKEIIEKLDIN